MKRLLSVYFIVCVVVLLGSCTPAYKMPKGFEQELRAFYTDWHEVNEQPFSAPLSEEQIDAMRRQGDDIVVKYGLKEQAADAGYFAEEIDSARLYLPLLKEYLEGWIVRNTTAEYQKLSKDVKQLTIDEIVENGKLLPIEKLNLVELGVVRNR